MRRERISKPGAGKMKLGIPYLQDWKKAIDAWPPKFFVLWEPWRNNDFFLT